jgi:hemerythrin-like domain-containing protein
MPSADDDDALAKLEASHRRHDDEMTALLSAAERLAGGDREAAQVVADVLDFLDRSTPRHFADEEQSLFPRVVAKAPELAARVQRLVDEHREHEALHVRLGERYDARDADGLLAEARSLNALYRRHVEDEDELFPQLAEIVGADALREVAREMQGRRGRGGGGGGRR